MLDKIRFGGFPRYPFSIFQPARFDPFFHHKLERTRVQLILRFRVRAHQISSTDTPDGEGSVSYSEATWNRAVEFVTLQWAHYFAVSGRSMPVPEILPGPAGSIDLYWKFSRFELLVNIPAEPQKPASFYGDDYGNAKIEGTFDPNLPNRGLLVWLKGL